MTLPHFANIRDGGNLPRQAGRAADAALWVLAAAIGLTMAWVLVETAPKSAALHAQIENNRAEW